MGVRDVGDQNSYIELWPIDIAHNAVYNYGGISVFDITDLSDIRCSFICIRHEDSDDLQEPPNTILDAASYVRRFNRRRCLSQEEASMISQCCALLPVSVAALKNRWPKGD